MGNVPVRAFFTYPSCVVSDGHTCCATHRQPAFIYFGDTFELSLRATYTSNDGAGRHLFRVCSKEGLLNDSVMHE